MLCDAGRLGTLALERLPVIAISFRHVAFGCVCFCASACASAATSGNQSPERPAAHAVEEPPVVSAEAKAPAVNEQTPAEAVTPAAIEPTRAAPTVAAASVEPAPAEDDARRYVDVVSEQGQRAHGLYINAPLAHKLGASGVAKLVHGVGLDAAVIDIKGSDGLVVYDTQIPELAGSKHILLRDAPAFVRQLKDAGIYTIARIVCFNDPILPRAFPDRSIQDGRPGHEGDIWLKTSRVKRNTWLDPYNEKNHEMLVAIAKEAEAIGFDEIQLDYIRFPVDVATKFAVYPAHTDQSHVDVILGVLRKIDAAIHIPIGADVFGLAAFKKGDPTGLLGQDLALWTQYIEVFSPMLYVYAMRDWMKHVKDGRAGLLVEQGVKELRQRVGAGPVIRPFLQAFSSRADYYNAEFITEQIRGTRNAGGDGFLFWSPTSTYNMVRVGMEGPARPLVPFPIERREAFRAKQWGETEQPEVAAPSLPRAWPRSRRAE